MSPTLKKQLAFNTFSGWAAQLIFALVGFCLIPFIVNRLGAQGYGIYQLVQSLLTFLMFLQLGMGPTLVRYLAKSMAQNDNESIRKICSSAQLMLGGLGGVAVVLCLVSIPFFIKFYDIPENYVHETIGLLICMSVSIFLNMIFIVPQGIIFGENRYDLANIIEILGSLLRLLMIALLFEFIRPSILFIGIAIMCAQLFRFVFLFGVAFEKSGNSILFSPRYVHMKTIRSLLSFSMLNLANSVAAAAVFQGPVLIIGKVLGQEMVTAFAPAILISGAIQGLLGQTTRPLVPLASRDQANTGGGSLGKWALSMGQVAAFIGFGIVLPLVTYGPELMGLWLGQDFAWIWLVVAVVTTGVAISQVQAANYFLALGGGNITPTVFSQIAMALVVFIGTLGGTVWFSWGLFEIALHICFCIFVRNTFYLAFAYSRQFSYPYRRYLYVVYGLPATIAGICSGVGWFVKLNVPPEHLMLLALQIFLMLLLYSLLSWWLILPWAFKQQLKSWGLAKIKKSPVSAPL